MGKPIGWKYLWQSYRRQSRHEEIHHPLITAPFVLVALSQCEDTYKVLMSVVGYVMSIFPSLTGLSLAGYTIIAGGLNMSVLRRMCSPGRDGMSMHQTLTTTFAVSMLIMLLTLGISFVIGMLGTMNFSSSNKDAVNFINCSLIILIVTAALASFRSLLSIIINIFNFGQYVNHSVYNRLDDSKLRRYRITLTASKQTR